MIDAWINNERLTKNNKQKKNSNSVQKPFQSSSYCSSQSHDDSIIFLFTLELIILTQKKSHGRRRVCWNIFSSSIESIHRTISADNNQLFQILRAHCIYWEETLKLDERQDEYSSWRISCEWKWSIRIEVFRTWISHHVEY